MSLALLRLLPYGFLERLMSYGLLERLTSWLLIMLTISTKRLRNLGDHRRLIGIHAVGRLLIPYIYMAWCYWMPLGCLSPTRLGHLSTLITGILGVREYVRH